MVFHAPAYKHFPLVEVNPLAVLANNVVSTDQVCCAAVANGVGQVVLISTDKIVRPNNVMGASKRLAEWWCRLTLLSPPAPFFSMVRFGNVLGSSGPVLPYFAARSLLGG